jgi:hypothetical protein
VHFDELDQALDPEVGERHDALVADPMDPDHAIFGFRRRQICLGMNP